MAAPEERPATKQTKVLYDQSPARKASESLATVTNFQPRSHS